jgi:hypothetical protein
MFQDCEVRVHFDETWKKEFARKYRDINGFSPSGQLSRYAIRRDLDLLRQTRAYAALIGAGISKAMGLEILVPAVPSSRTDSISTGMHGPY